MLTGSLKTFSFTNLMQMCYNENTTGTIEFTKDSSSYAKMGFTGGRLTHANFLDSEGGNAVKQLTLLKDLDFNFKAEQIAAEPNITTDINFLLLECSRFLDECMEHMEMLRQVFSARYNLEKADFYQYRHGHFIFPDVYPVRYFETYDQNEMSVVFHHDKMGAKVELIFHDKILTNDLLMFMDEKDIFR